MNINYRLLFFLLLLKYSLCLQVHTREGKITGGYEAEPHSNPYVVSLQSRILWRRYYRLCTGSILSEEWILSAGHCVTDSWARWYPMDAFVGAHNIERVSESQIYPISQRIAHPMYRGGVGPYDIAMMKTSRRIEYSENVQPINLPMTNSMFRRDEKLLITGWGASKSTFFVTVLPNRLREAKVTYLPYHECYRAINKIKDWHEYNPLKRTANLCTGPLYGYVAGCTGDSGGPLVQFLPKPTEETTQYEMTSDKEETSTSPMPMTTDRTSTTYQSTTSPKPMTTDRTSTTYQSTTSPKPMTTNRPSTSTTSPMPMTTDRPSTSTTSPMPMTTDRPSTSTTMTTMSPMPMTTDRPSTTTMTSTTMELTTSEEITAPEMTIPDETTDLFRSLSHNQTSSRTRYLRASRRDFMPTVVGVMSWGVVPCGDGAPTVYSNVTHYMDFINEYLYS